MYHMKKSEKEVNFAKLLQDQSWAEEEEEALELPFCFASNGASISGRFKRLGFAASWDDKKALELPSVLLPTVASISSSSSSKQELQKRDGDAAKKKDTNP